MENSITIIYFDKESYLHNLYIGYGITALKTVSVPLTAVYVDEENLFDVINHLRSKYIVVFLSLGRYSIFKKFCEFKPGPSIVIACHYVPTYLGKEILLDVPSVDYIIAGEFDITLPCLVQYLIQEKDVSNCKGILMRSEKKIIYTGNRPLIDSLDSLGFPDWGEITPPAQIYHIFASRGCEGRCTFCDRNALYRDLCVKQRFRSIKNVGDEIDLLVNRFGCRIITFSDSTFCSSDNIRNRLHELYCELKSKKYWVQFFINLRAEQISDDVLNQLQLLKQVGLSRVFIGIESFNTEDLEIYNKSTTVEVSKNAIELINLLPSTRNDYLLDFEYGFILFNPYTTFEELKNNLNELLKANIILTPNIISSRLICNCIEPITRKIYEDGLLETSLDCSNLTQRTAFDIKYRFQDKRVERIYQAIITCYNVLSVKLQGGIIFIRNRYYHFFGEDAVLSKLDDSYNEWQSALSDFCKKIISEILDMENEKRYFEDYAINLCKEFKSAFAEIERKLQVRKQRAFIELQKIGEAIYEN